MFISVHPIVRQKMNMDPPHPATVNPALSAHWLRHAHASHALNRGATIAEVKDTLGRANVATTSVYLHARPERSSGLVMDEGIFR